MYYRQRVWFGFKSLNNNPFKLRVYMHQKRFLTLLAELLLLHFYPSSVPEHAVVVSSCGLNSPSPVHPVSHNPIILFYLLDLCCLLLEAEVPTFQMNAMF